MWRRRRRRRRRSLFLFPGTSRGTGGHICLEREGGIKSVATPPLVGHLPTWEDDTISLQICHEIRWKCNKLTVGEKQVLREGGEDEEKRTF